MSTYHSIVNRKCKPCVAGAVALNEPACRDYLGALEGWVRNGQAIEKTWRFRDHCEAVAFVNAIAWISHREDHHPEVTLGYADCRVSYWTHAVGGLTENDFICAAKVDRLFSL